MPVTLRTWDHHREGARHACIHSRGEAVQAAHLQRTASWQVWSPGELGWHRVLACRAPVSDLTSQACSSPGDGAPGSPQLRAPEAGLSELPVGKH